MNAIKIFVVTLIIFIALGTESLFADASFVTTATSARVSTDAGANESIGLQEPPSSGQIRNNVFVEVKENDQGIGGGSATGEVVVSQVNNKHVFAKLQSTASSLLETGNASSESSFTFAFNFAGKIFVERGIRQGISFIFIDGIKQDIKSEYDVFEGIHKFEIRVQTGDGITNPNFAVFVDAIEGEPKENEGPANPPPNDPAPPSNNPTVSVKAQITTIKQQIKNVKAPKNKAQKTALQELLTSIKTNEASLREQLTISNAAVSGKVSLQKLLSKVKSTASALKNKSGDALKEAKKNANKAFSDLEKALGI